MPIISATLGQHSPQYTVKKARIGYSTENPANHLTARFTSEGIGLQRLHAEWGMQLTGWGYDANVTAAAKVAPHSTANRVEYARENLTEWYVNGPVGLEQSFRIAHAPWSENKGQHTLTLSFALRGNWNNPAETRNQEILLQDENGGPALRYGGLTVHDASGRVLTSWMDVHAQNLQLEVAVEGAEFPVIIDPTYSEIAQLSASSAPPNSLLGAAVAISDDGSVIVAGACGISSLNCSTTINGAAYIFVEPQGGWAAAGTTTQPAVTLTSGLPAGIGDGFGSAVAISGDGKTIVVTAPQSQCDNGQSCTGEAFVFIAASEAWTAQNQNAVAVLQATDSTPGDFFGTAVAIDGTGSTIVIRQYNPNTYYSHLNLYLEPSGGWAKEPGGEANENAQLQSSDAQAGDNFGNGVAIGEDSSTIATGASAANSFKGEAYVFVKPAAGWSSLPGPETGKLTSETVMLQSSDNSGSSEFGWWTAVDQSGDTILIGAPYQNQTNAQAAGEAYVFLRPSGANGWATTNPLTETTRLEASGSAAAGNGFGVNVSISEDGTTVAVSSELTGVYLFSEPNNAWPTSTPPAATPILNSSPNPINLTPANIVSLGNGGFFGVVSGDTAAGTATGTVLVSVPGNNSNSGTVFVYGPQAVTCPTISISPSSLPNATVGQAYTEQLSATGGTSPLQWAISSAPTWLTISTSGELSGTPSGGGTFSITVMVTDKNNCPGEATLALTVNPAATTMTITSTSASYYSHVLPTNTALVNSTPVTVNFSVTTSGSVAPTGTVTVTDGFNDPCTPSPTTLTAGNGSCTVTISQYPQSGSTTLTATYAPSSTASFSGSTGTLTETLAEIIPCSSAQDVTVKQGAFAVTTITVCVAGNITATPLLQYDVACMKNGSCHLSIAPVSGQPGVYAITATIYTYVGGTGGASAPGMRFTQPRRGPWPPTLFWLALFLVMAIAIQIARQCGVRPRRQWAAASLLFAATLFCGISGCSGTGKPVTPPGTYTINVTVTAGTYSITVPLTVTVTK